MTEKISLEQALAFAANPRANFSMNLRLLQFFAAEQIVDVIRVRKPMHVLACLDIEAPNVIDSRQLLGTIVALLSY